jgi:ATP-binding cassette subfamily B protein
VSGGAGPLPGGCDLLTNAAWAFAQARAAAPAHLLGLVMVSVLGAGVPLAVAWSTKSVLDGVVAGAGFGELAGWAAALAAVGAVAAVLPQLNTYLNGELSRRSAVHSMERLYRAVGAFVGLGRFEDPHSLDRLRLADGSTRAPAQVVGAGLQVGQAALTVAGFVGALAILSPVMTAVVVVAAVPTLIAELALSRRRGAMLWEIGPAERKEFLYSDLLTTVNAAKEIRLYGLSDFLRSRMLLERRTADAARRAMDLRETGTQGGLALLSALVAGGGLVWAIRAAAQGQLSVGDVALFVSGVAGVQGSVGGLISGFATGHHQLLVFDHYRLIVASGSDLPVPAAPRPVPGLRRGIEFRDVWFRYSDDHPWALRGINLHIPHGRAVGLVGRNGAGKSTLVKLLCRFYDPTKGGIYWDGTDIRDLDPASLRARLAAVFQDYMEYDMTAAENIGIGDLAGMHDRDRVMAAGSRAGIHDKLVALPQGYDTLLTRMFTSSTDEGNPETGVVVSGGQWQRLALARALIRDEPDLMILDEPSAGLDAEAEAQIHDQLRRHRAGRTSLLISHRLGTIRDADHIVVLDDGALIEQGRHTELMAHGGTYARLFRMQAAGYDDAPAGEAAVLWSS